MKYTIKQFAEVAGVIAVILSLLFVGFELRLSRSIAETENINQEAELFRTMNEYISANADVWAKGCLGEDLTPSEAVRYTNVTLTVINHQWSRWRRSDAGIANQRSDLVIQLMAENIYNFPGFKNVWEIRRNEPAFQEAVNSRHQQLLDSGAERSYDVAWCGKWAQSKT